MKKILSILFFVLAAQAFSQVDNRFRYNWIYPQEFSGGIVLPNLSNGTDTIFLVLNGATGEIDSIGITELKSIFSGGGNGDVSFSDTNSTIATKYDLDTMTVSSSRVSRTELGDSTSAVRTDLTEDILLRLEISDTSGMLNTYSRLQDLSDTAAVLRSLINSGGGSGGASDTTYITGGSDTIINADSEVWYISTSDVTDSLYLGSNLELDSLSAVYIENYGDGELLIISGITNTLNGSVSTTLNVPARSAVFIRYLGTISGTRRFEAIGKYTAE